jgi:hypothetical protein
MTRGIALLVLLLFFGPGPADAGGATQAASAPGRRTRPDIGLSLGGLLPLSDNYNGNAWLTSARLSLQRDFRRSYVEMGIPFAGIAWSGGIVPADCETKVLDWTIFDVMAGGTVPIHGHRAHFGLGVGVHRLSVSGSGCVIPLQPAKTAVCKAKCGNDQDDTMFSVEAGAGYRLLDETTADLDLAARLRTPLPPTSGEDDVAGPSLLVQLVVIF